MRQASGTCCAYLRFISRKYVPYKFRASSSKNLAASAASRSLRGLSQVFFLRSSTKSTGMLKFYPYFCSNCANGAKRNKLNYLYFSSTYADGVVLKLKNLILPLFQLHLRGRRRGVIIFNYLYFSPTCADGAECVYDGQQAREHTSVAELALA